eukprot:TRINITY_DN2631_c0_g1_i1.p1 TRINITY_DN2631_c0_g1~~TRINITY_DN2631_c0_g1_i1.p1  ORF type:complete len:484 (+),score=53.23 TRINITY_DN2631_c0_g1_i1:206-1657(+)
MQVDCSLEELQARGTDVNFTDSNEGGQIGVIAKAYHTQCCDSLLILAGSEGQVDYVTVQGQSRSMNQKALVSYRQEKDQQDIKEISRSVIFWSGVDRILSIAANHNGQVLAVGTEQQTFIQFFFRDPASGQLSEGKCVCLRTVHMCNSVRFGMICKQEFLLVAGQSGFIYILRIPTQSEGFTKASLACLNLPMDEGCEENEVVRNAQLVANGVSQVRVMIQMEVQLHQFQGFDTLCIGRFEEPINYVELSPNGRWIVVGLDSTDVTILSRSNDFKLDGRLLLNLSNGLGDVDAGPRGVQYCAWNSSSTLLAASSDEVNCVSVWSVPEFELVVRLSRHERPCLAIKFVTESFLAYVEESSYCHLVDVNYPLQGHQVLYIDEEEQSEDSSNYGQQSSKIAGLGVSHTGEVVVAVDGRFSYKWKLINNWSKNDHSRFPTKFKQAVKVLLSSSKTSTQLGSLPQPVVLKIIRMAAMPLADWFNQEEP